MITQVLVGGRRDRPSEKTLVETRESPDTGTRWFRGTVCTEDTYRVDTDGSHRTEFSMAAIPESIPVSEDGYAFPVSDLLTGRGAVFGKSGSGKSNTASVLAEELLEYGLPIVIVDIEGEYWGLTERYDLRYAGTTEDAEIEVAIGNVDDLVSMVLEDNEPLIVDVSGMADEEAVDAFLSAFVSRLFERENQVRKPCLLVVEEIHEFLPQTGRGGAFADVLVTVAKRGRKRGLGLCGLSQRPAAVDKEFITQCDWIAWHRLTWENDTKVVERVIGADAAAPVPTLEDGEALVMTDWDEELTRVQFKRKRTFDAGSTPDLSAFEADELGPSRTTESDEGTVPGVEPSRPTDGRSDGAVEPDADVDPTDASASTDDSPTERPLPPRTDGFDPLTEAALLTVYGVTYLRRRFSSSLRRGGSICRRRLPRHRSPRGERSTIETGWQSKGILVAIGIGLLVLFGVLAAILVGIA